MTFDIEQPEQLIAYLRRMRRIGMDETPEIRVLGGGVSNGTVWLKRANGEAWVIKQALPKLRVQVDWFSDPARSHREALGLYWLEQIAPPGTLPRYVFEDEDNYIFAMEAIPQPHENWKTMLLRGDLHEDHVRQFGVLLGTIHRESHRRAAEMQPVFADRSFFQTLRAEAYYAYTGTQVPQATAFIDQLLAEMDAITVALVHGDYSPKNILVYQNRLILLDHEVCHWGDPGFDIGFSMTHLLSKAHHLPEHRPRFQKAARLYWKVYWAEVVGQSWAQDLEARAARHVLACLLARVAGRSPLEYMNADERARQRAVVTNLMADAPTTINELVTRFIDGIERA